MEMIACQREDRDACGIEFEISDNAVHPDLRFI